MALQPKELFGSATSQTPNLRAYPAEDGIRPGSLEALAADADLAHLTPLSYDSGDEDWGVYEDDGGTAQVNVLTAASTTATDGTYTLTIAGETTSALAHDAAAAAILAAIVALGYTATTDVTVVDGGGGLASNNGTATITFVNSGALSGPVSVSADFAELVGNVHVLSTSAAGTATDVVDGFLWAPAEAHAGLAAGETLIQVFRAGVIHAADVPTPSGVQRTNLETALKSILLRQKGIAVQGLPGVA